MAKYYSSTFGKISGKHGTAVAVTRKDGVTYLRLHVPPSNPIFKETMGITNGISTARSYAFKNAIVGEYPDFSIDYKKLMFSFGPIEKLHNASFTRNAGIVSINWDFEEMYNCHGDDSVSLVVYNKNTNQVLHIKDFAFRSDKNCKIDIHETWADADLYFWAYVRSGDEISDSSCVFEMAVGADLCVCPDMCVCPDRCVCPMQNAGENLLGAGGDKLGAHEGGAVTNSAGTKQYIQQIILCIIIAIGAISCNPQPEADKLLHQAQEVVEAYPDSAMKLIDSIFYPEKSLRHERYMEFLITQVQAKHKNYRSVAEDTLIFEARDYFDKKNKYPEQTALAYFYSGFVYREQKHYNQAMQHYKKAENFASQTNNINLRGLVEYNMGDLLYEQGYHQQALAHYSEVADIYDQPSGDFHERLAYSFGAMGRMYLLLEQPDSAYIYFQKGLDIAENSNDKGLQSQLMQNVSVMYKESREYEKSEYYLRQSYKLNEDSTKTLRYYLNFAEIYLGMNQTDSVSLYVELLKREIENRDNNYLKASAYHFLANREKELRNFDTAFDYQDKFSYVLGNITRERLEQSVYEVQTKYDYEKIKNESERQLTSLLSWLIIMLFGIIISGSLFSWHYIRQKNKFIHVQQQTEFLKEIAVDLNQSHKLEMAMKDKNMRELLLWKMNVVTKSASLSSHDKNNLSNAQLVSEFYKIVYQDNKSDHWHNILLSFEQLNVGITDKLKTLYPNLNDTDFKIAILTYAGMTVRDISIILDFSANTVQAYRNALRKKLNITDASVDTVLFLKKMLD